MRSLLVAMLLGFGVAACTVADFHAPDAGEVGPPDASGEVALVATSPAAGAVAVDVVTDVTLTFTGAIDPASIDGAIHVYERSSRREIPITDASWDDATSTITVSLGRLLRFATPHRVEVDGLTADGEPVAVSTFQFRTYVNEYQRYRRWTGGLVTERTDYTLDAEGFIATVAGYTAGTDGTFETADDVVLGWSAYDYTEDGSYAGVTSYTGEVITSYNVYDHGVTDAGHHRIRAFSDPGVDGLWRTADDVASYWQTFAYDDQDRVVLQVGYNNGGDVPSAVYATSYPTPTSSEFLHYNGPGEDATWLTADDAVFRRHVTTLDARGNALTVRTYDGAGVLQYHQVNELDVTGLVTRTLWFTAGDDLSPEYRVFTFDAQHRQIRNASLDLGPNGVGPDADDREVRAYFQYDVTH